MTMAPPSSAPPERYRATGSPGVQKPTACAGREAHRLAKGSELVDVGFSTA